MLWPPPPGSTNPPNYCTRDVIPGHENPAYRVPPPNYNWGMELQQMTTGNPVQDAIALLTGLPAADCQENAIERTQVVEQAIRMLSADQAGSAYAFVGFREAQERDLRIPQSQQLKGIEAEIGLARGESAYVGSALTHTAIDLHTVLPNTLAALKAGRVSEYHARLVAEQTNHLSDEHRLEIDAAIAHRLGKASSTQLRRLITGHAFRLDRKAAEARAESNKARRRVCMDPAGDGLVYVSAELPTQQGIAVMEELQRKTNQRIAAKQGVDADGQPLSRDRVMADLFVELLTGQTTANGVTAEILVIMHDTTLFGDDDLPAWIVGHGPLPAGTAKDWLADPDAKKFLRRMYTRPADGQLVALESKRRRFPEGLAKMLRIREDICATPWCNSPVQDSDHRQPWAQGGTTTWDNGTGLCKRCNQRKENRGWTYTGTPDLLTVTTPTGHSYTVGTRPPLAEIAYWSSDPPLNNMVIDITWPVAA